MWRNPGEIPGNSLDDDGNGYADDSYGIDAVNADSDPIDQPVGFIYHGTACASIIGGVGNCGRGLTGVNWRVRLMALRLAAASNFISGGGRWVTTVLQMKQRGVNVRVTSNSYGIDDAPSQALRDAIQAVGDAGIISVFAAGNAARNVDMSCDYPACFRLTSMLNVAATDQSDVLAVFFELWGDECRFGCARCEHTGRRRVGTNTYNGLQRTSAACPYVAGAAALLAAAYPSATVAEIKAALMQTVDFLPSLTNKMVSHGRLNVGRAIYHPGLFSDAPPHVIRAAGGSNWQWWVSGGAVCYWHRSAADEFLLAFRGESNRENERTALHDSERGAQQRRDLQRDYEQHVRQGDEHGGDSDGGNEPDDPDAAAGDAGVGWDEHCVQR